MGAAVADVVQVVKTYWPLLLGNALEWYEFSLFGYLSPYFQVNFFQDSAVAAWLGFAITFVARPLGGIVLGLVGDVFGRKVSAFVSIFGMLFGTVLQGALPTYQCGEVAGALGLAMLVFLRLLQGISAGGEIASVTTYIIEVGNPRSLASSLVLIPATASLGSFVAQLVTFSLEGLLGDAAMISWGWRLPFLLALLPGLLAALGRRSLSESSSFQAAARAEKAAGGAAWRAVMKLKELVVDCWPQVLVGLGAVAALAVNLYGGMTWTLVSLKKQGVSSDVRTAAAAVSKCMIWLLVPLVGFIGDQRGAAWVQLVISLTMAIIGMPLLMSIEESVENPKLVILFYGVGFGFLQAFLMVVALQVVELFPVEVRNAGMGLSYNVGMCIFGGFAPMAFEAAAVTAPWMPPFLLSIGGLITALTTLISLCLRSQGKIQLTHVRHEPYFHYCGRERFVKMQKHQTSSTNETKKQETSTEFQSVLDI